MGVEGNWFVVIGEDDREQLRAVRMIDGKAIWNDNSVGEYLVAGDRLTITVPAWAASLVLEWSDSSAHGSIDQDGEVTACSMMRATDEEWAGAFTDTSAPPRDRLKVIV